MTFRSFAFGLTATFGIAWLALVIVPFFLMRVPKPVPFVEAKDGKEGFYHPKRSGRVVNGAEVYAANGCYHCHTQLIRPSYAGNDLGRPDWAGLKKDEERGDTRRESNIFDYQGEKFAQIGTNRLGPDLSNVGRRVEAIYAKGADPEAWLLMHLYDPRANPQRPTSTCPSFRFLFKEEKVEGQTPADALPVQSPEGTAIVPTGEAISLVEYLLSLKRDDTVPASMSHGKQAAKPAEAKPATP